MCFFKFFLENFGLYFLNKMTDKDTNVELTKQCETGNSDIEQLKLRIKKLEIENEDLRYQKSLLETNSRRITCQFEDLKHQNDILQARLSKEEEVVRSQAETIRELRHRNVRICFSFSFVTFFASF